MQKISNPQSNALLPDGGRTDERAAKDGLSLVDLVENCVSHRWPFAIVTVTIVALTFLYAISATPVYTSDVLIQVEERKGTNLGALNAVAKALDVQQSPVQGEIEIARSRQVVGKAVESERAHTSVSLMSRAPVVGNFISSRLPRQTSTGLASPFLGLGQYSWGGEYLELDEFDVPPRLLARPLKLILGKDSAWELSDEQGKVMLSGSGKNIAAVDIEGGKLQLKVSSMNGHPGTAFRLVRLSTESKVQQVIRSTTAAETRRGSSLMRLTISDVDPKRGASMLNAIADAYVQHNLERRSEEADKSLIFLRTQLPQLKANLEEAERRLNTFRNQEKSIDISGEIRVLLDRSATLEKSRLELELKKKELLQRYEALHPSVVAIDNQLKTLTTAAKEQVRDISGLPRVQQDYIRLARDVEVANQLYVGLLNNSQQLQVAKAGTTGNVSIIDRAIVPERATRPNKPYIMVVGTLIAVILGFLLAQVLALVSKVVREPGTLESATGLPTMAILPIAHEQEQALQRPGNVFMLAHAAPNSIPVEAMRSLRTAAYFSLSETDRGKVILITSAVPGQGKSFISANLAYLCASGGRRVLLIDADVRRSTIGKYISQPTGANGLSSFLQDGVPIDSLILKSVHPQLDLLPAGKPIKNPGDLITRGGIAQAVSQLAEQYDLVIIDSPPVLPVNDAAGLIGCVDITLFIARQGRVTQSEVDEALILLQRAGKQVTGTVFNGFVASRLRYGYGYKYGYYRYGYGNGYKTKGYNSDAAY